MREQAKEFRDKLKKECDNSELTFDEAIDFFNNNKYIDLLNDNYTDLAEGIGCVVQKVFIAPKNNRSYFINDLDEFGDNYAYKKYRDETGWCCMCRVTNEKKPFYYEYCGFIKYCLSKK